MGRGPSLLSGSPGHTAVFGEGWIRNRDTLDIKPDCGPWRHTRATKCLLRFGLNLLSLQSHLWASCLPLCAGSIWLLGEGPGARGGRCCQQWGGPGDSTECTQPRRDSIVTKPVPPVTDIFMGNQSEKHIHFFIKRRANTTLASRSCCRVPPEFPRSPS